jgi:hypothetical protein
MRSEKLAKLPTQFRGCIWDAGWEFDAPCVIYSPVQIYSHGGNSGSDAGGRRTVVRGGKVVNGLAKRLS